MVEISLNSLPLNMEVTAADLSKEASLALETLDSFYDSPDPLKCKQDLFHIAMDWMQELKASQLEMSLSMLAVNLRNKTCHYFDNIVINLFYCYSSYLYNR